MPSSSSTAAGPTTARAASDDSASASPSTTVVSAGGTKITFTNGATASPTVQPSEAPISAIRGSPLPSSSKSIRGPPPAPEDAPLTRNTTRRLSASTERPRYREMSSDSGGEVSDGDPPGYTAPPPVVSKGKAREVPLVERNYHELEDIIFSNPKTFTSMVFEIGETRRANLFVSVDRTDKKASAFMHITCAYRGAGCPFILKLTRAKEGGWILKPATTPTGEVDTKGSFYACHHPPGSVPDKAPILGPTGGVAPPGSVFEGVAAPSLINGGAPSPAATAKTFTFVSGYEATPPPGKGKTKKKAPAVKKAAAPKKGSPAGSPAPLDYQSDSVSGKLVPSRESRTANVAERNTLANPQVVGNMVKTKPIDPDRALAPPFLRSLSLQKQIAPVLSYERYNTPGESSLNARAPHYIPGAASSFPSHIGREQPHASTSAARQVSPTYDHRSTYTLPQHFSQSSHSPFPPQAQPNRSHPSGLIHPPPPSHHQSQQFAGDQAYPYQPSYRHILVAQPPTAPAPPRPSLLPTTSSLSSWTAFLTALDPTLIPFAKVLAAPTMALTPESFFAESLEMRLALIEVLEVEQVGVWPRLRLKMKVKQKGEEVWKTVEEEERKRNRELRAKEVEREKEQEKAREKAREVEKEQQAKAMEARAREQEARAREQKGQAQAQAMEGVEQARSSGDNEVVMKEVSLIAASAPAAEEPKEVPPAPTQEEESPMVVDTPSAPAAPTPAPITDSTLKSKGKRGTKASKFKSTTKPASTAGVAVPYSIAVPETPLFPMPVVSPSSTPKPPADSVPPPPASTTIAPASTTLPAASTPIVASSSSTALTAAVLEKVTAPSTRKDIRAPTSPLSSAMSISSDEDGDIPLVQLSAKAREASKAKEEKPSEKAPELRSVAQLRKLVVTYAEGLSTTGLRRDDKGETLRYFDAVAWQDVSKENRRSLLREIEEVLSARKEVQVFKKGDDIETSKEAIRRVDLGEQAILARLRRGGQDPDSPLEPISLISDDEAPAASSVKINGKREEVEEGADSPRDGSPDELLVTAVTRPSSTANNTASPTAPPSRNSSNSFAPPPPSRPSAANSNAGATVRSSIGGAPVKNGRPSENDVKSAVALAFRKVSTAGVDGGASASSSRSGSPTSSTRAAPSKRPRSPTPPPVYPTLNKPPLPPSTSPRPRVDSAGDKVRRELAYRHTPPPPKSSPRPPSGTIIPFPTGPPKEKNAPPPPPPNPPPPPPPGPPPPYKPVSQPIRNAAAAAVTSAASAAAASTSTPRSSYPPPRPSGTPSHGPDPSIRIKTPANSLSSSTSRLASSEPRHSNGSGSNDQGRRSSWYGPSGGRDDDGYGGIPGLSPPPPPPSNGGGGGNGPRYGAAGGTGGTRGGYNDRWAPHSSSRDDGYSGGQAKRRRN
ncbi:hypothetical protein BCR35DRAFT_304617 [Leucosporidium creatinivorum]|uniref:Uncharacterized protein n=1 Tax=Leucosporidium creatinivorum TaxID=106004 RepID=A0A1Y2F7B6_9BASI|nr:hypothetical protein BCR35DRAFT_304617 [Leucosporidium creatinivorum]